MNARSSAKNVTICNEFVEQNLNNIKQKLANKTNLNGKVHLDELK